MKPYVLDYFFFLNLQLLLGLGLRLWSHGQIEAVTFLCPRTGHQARAMEATVSTCPAQLLTLQLGDPEPRHQEKSVWSIFWV